MDRPMTHRQIQELLGAYALDAVDGDEAEVVELHLRECPRCRAEVEEHRETAATLAHLGAPAPAGLWDRIASQLEEEAPDFATGVGARARADGRPAGARGPGSAGAGGVDPMGSGESAAEAVAGPTAGGPAGSGVPGVGRAGWSGEAGIPGGGPAGSGEPGQAETGPGAGAAGRRGLRAVAGGAGLRAVAGGGGAGKTERTSRLFRVASAGLAAAAVLAVVLGVQVVRLNQRIDRMTATVSHRGIDQAALAALADPSGRRVHLRSNDGPDTADAVLLPNGQAYLVSAKLPALSADRTYQLWAVVGDQKISVGVLGSDPGVTAFRYSAQPSALAITAEQGGGVVAPQHSPVVVGVVPA
jgi:anti-sigma-K factor RskA